MCFIDHKWLKMFVFKITTAAWISIFCVTFLADAGVSETFNMMT